MWHGLPDMTLLSKRHKVILHGLQEVTSERQVISHDPSVSLMVQNGRKCITYIYYIIKQLLTCVSIDMELHVGQYDVCCSIILHVHLNISCRIDVN